MAERRAPSLQPRPAEDGLSVPRRMRGHARAPRRRRGPVRWLLWLLSLTLALVLLPVLALRFLPPPTSAFMLQSPTRPVQYRWVALDRIAEPAQRAVVAAEDQKFWQHQGFDLEAIEKAVEHNRKSRRKRGASTISQQTAKNLFLWSGGGYFRKGIEAGYTMLIEWLWPKQRILEVYLNIAEFGPGIYGVEAAAQRFFGKPAAQLTATEAARLAAVLPSPRRWSAARPGPYVLKRSQWILRQMGYGPRLPPVQEDFEPEPEYAPGDEADDADPGPDTPEVPAAATPLGAPALGADVPMAPSEDLPPPADAQPTPATPDESAGAGAAPQPPSSGDAPSP